MENIISGGFMRIIRRNRFRRKKDAEFSLPLDPDSKHAELTSDNLRAILDKNSDVQFREICVSANGTVTATLLYVDGLVDNKLLSEALLKPIAREEALGKSCSAAEIIRLIERGAVYVPSLTKRTDVPSVLNDVLSDSAALVFDSEKTALTFVLKGFDKRSMTEPTGENVIKGARDAFVETLRVNTATVRRKIGTPGLVIEETTVGRRTLTSVAVVYIEGVTDPELVSEVKKRLAGIDVDGVVSPGYIEEYIIDNIYTPFPLLVYTERPDKFCTNILAGRVGIIVDGLPTAYLVPGTFDLFLHAPEDYSQNYLLGSMLRFTRYALMAITLVLPAFYISVTTFHQEMIPTELALAIAASKMGVPFPSFIEVLVMVTAFEILQEAGIRLPRTIGQAVSIVGTVIVGQAAIGAKLVSPGVVVVVAFTGIAAYTMPSQDLGNALRLVRLIFIILSGMLGLIGLSFGIIILLYHLCTIETFGVPYLAPFAGTINPSFKDTIIRFPLKHIKMRPPGLKTVDRRKQK
jgi:spore germination protein KA